MVPSAKQDDAGKGESSNGLVNIMRKSKQLKYKDEVVLVVPGSQLSCETGIIVEARRLLVRCL